MFVPVFECVVSEQRPCDYAINFFQASTAHTIVPSSDESALELQQIRSVIPARLTAGAVKAWPHSGIRLHSHVCHPDIARVETTN